MKKSSFGDLSLGEREAIAERIRRMVDAAGSQPAAAVHAQVSVRQIAAYVAGESAPPLLPIARLAMATGYSLDWVMTGAGDERRGTKAKDSTALATVAHERADTWAGGPAALFVVSMLEHAGLFTAYAEEGFPLEERDEEEVLGIARAIAKALAAYPREQWADLVKLAVAVQRAALAHARRVAGERARKRR